MAELYQSVIVSDLLITELRDRVYAEGLMSECGVRLHFDIPWSKMPFYRHQRDTKFGGELWEFSNKVFKIPKEE